MKIKLILVFGALLITSISRAECCCAQKQATPKTKIVYRTKVVEKIVEKIVPTEKIVVVKELVPVEKAIITEKVVVVKVKPKKNRISVLAGTGPVDLVVDPNSAKITRDGILGLQYQRSLGMINLGIQIQTNQSVLGSIGLDF